jgi:salicylate hydroxylase
MSGKPIEVAVVGGGMGGLCVAIGFLKHPNLKVQIYEAAHHFSEIGAGVAFGPNAQRALKLIGDSTEQAYLRQATHNGWKKHANIWFEHRMGMGEKEDRVLAAARNETGQATVHRAKFLDEFVKLVPEEICHFGKRLTELKELENGRIQLHFKDETTAEADCVIGADGVHSVVRRYLLGDNDPTVDPVFTGSVAYRGLIPMEKAVAAIGEVYAENSYVWCGHGGCVMTYPIDFGATMNIVAINSSYEKWEGPWVQKADYNKIAQEFDAWGSHVKNIIKLLADADASAWCV